MELRILPALDHEVETSFDPELAFEMDHLETIERLKMQGIRVKIHYDKLLGRFAVTASLLDGRNVPLYYRAFPEG